MTAVDYSQNWLHENWRWFALGSLVVALLFVGIYGTLWLVARQFWPQGAPIKVLKFGILPPAAAPGDKIKVHLEFEKYRSCDPRARLVFINPEGEERPFIFQEWPSRGVSVKPHVADVPTEIPTTLGTGAFKVQASVTYVCSDGYYLAETDAVPLQVIPPMVKERGQER